jgi:hypothetical protein
MKYKDNEVFEFKSIAEAKPTYYHLAIQGPASAQDVKSLAAAHGAGS